ncbi:MAG TPA: EF-P lysine aminoacylase EpmA [Steroidobacteraceae bacterium]
MSGDWRPTAALETLRLRAKLLAEVRSFFASRNVLEVDTPALVRHAVTDRHIHSARVELPGHPAALYLATSPEYAMKRLLAAGSGDIYQMAHVFRGSEQGRWHNAEFMLIEWYRGGFAMQQLMQEVATLTLLLLGLPEGTPVSYLRYAEGLSQHLGADPVLAPDAELRRLAIRHRLDADLAARCDRDQLLDWLVGSVVGPQLGLDGLCFVHHYPASQASLARIDPEDERVALRFELYHRGIELANGFEELADTRLQRARFQRDRQQRSAAALPVPDIDEALLAALAAGLPSVSGVALGFDRLLMLRTGATNIEAVLPFPLQRA